jgi:hypothetical protein
VDAATPSPTTCTGSWGRAFALRQPTESGGLHRRCRSGPAACCFYLPLSLSERCCPVVAPSDRRCSAHADCRRRLSREGWPGTSHNSLGRAPSVKVREPLPGAIGVEPWAGHALSVRSFRASTLARIARSGGGHGSPGWLYPGLVVLAQLPCSEHSE